MRTCGLGTEQVGLPIEKTLTVKSEGSVAVSLTLSASAPYKIVSVLPTLSPEQSGQVTVRFDPNESGTFTGSVQGAEITVRFNAITSGIYSGNASLDIDSRLIEVPLRATAYTLEEYADYLASLYNVIAEEALSRSKPPALFNRGDLFLGFEVGEQIHYMLQLLMQLKNLPEVDNPIIDLPDATEILESLREIRSYLFLQALERLIQGQGGAPGDDSAAARGKESDKL